MAIAAALILWLGRGTTFWIDELTWLLQSPHLGLSDALRPHEGHLVLVTRLVYWATLEIFDSSYLPFRLLATATVLATVALLFAYARRRVPPLVALAPCLILLFFGSDMLHVLVGNAFAVLFSVVMGLAALLSLERDDLRGRLAACAFLSVGLATYSVALGFLAAATVLLLREKRGLRSLWVVALPAALYLGWWIWSRAHFDATAGGAGGISPENVLLVPAWSFQSLGAALGALSGLEYGFGGAAPVARAGSALALLAIGALAWRLRGGDVSARAWSAIALVLALWTIGALTASPARLPDSARYLFPVAVSVLVLAAAAAEGAPWDRTGLIVLFLFCAAGLGTNLVLLRDAGTELRGRYAVQVRAAFGGLDMVGPRAAKGFEPPSVANGFVAGGQSPLAFPFYLLAEDGEAPTRAYFAAARRYGSLGYTQEQLEGRPEEVRAQADAVMAAALGIGLVPRGRLEGRGDCSRPRPSGGGSFALRLPRGGAVLEGGSRGGSVGVRRLAGRTAVDLGKLAPGEVATLRVAPDRSSRPWTLTTTASSLKVCALR